jgi:hypothetical protein
MYLSTSTKGWQKYFPGIYIIKSEEDIKKAIRLIRASYYLRYDDIEEYNRDEQLETIIEILQDQDKKFNTLENLVYDQIKITDDLETFLRDRLQTKFEKISNSLRDLRSGKKTKKEFFIDVGKAIGSPAFKILIKSIYKAFL